MAATGRDCATRAGVDAEAGLLWWWARMFSPRRWFAVLAAAVLLAAVLVVAAAGQPSDPTNWPAFMFGPARSSFNQAATAITPANAPNLVHRWHFSPAPPTKLGQPAAALFATPVTYDGVVYVGANSGDFYAVKEATGALLWKRFLGFTSARPCAPQGVVSTATVAPAPITGDTTVYVGGGDGNVYALNAADGSVRWKTPVAPKVPSQNQPYLWSSAAVANGRVYIGIASLCDNFTPVAGGGVVALDQSTGAPRATYLTEPPGGTGAGVWSSPAIDPTDGSVFVTTGNPGQTPDRGDGDSILRLNGTTLARLDKWTVPAAARVVDSDFGASPTLFRALASGGTRQLVGACNKNGTFYAFSRSALSAGPIWRLHVGAGSSGPPACLAGAAFDGTHLYVGANATTVAGTAYRGSLRALNPGTGKVVWALGLPEDVLGGATVDGSGVVAVGTADYRSATNATRLIDKRTGAILKTFATGFVFAQPVWADNMLIVATKASGLHGYGLP
jgi:polyvinyl alcohol dehydrogenase (cytochrome)